MRKYLLLAVAGTVAAALAPIALVPIALADDASNAVTCLRTDRIDRFSYVDRQTIRAKDRAGQAYTVTLRNLCGYRKLAQALSYEPWQLGQCLDAGDVLVSENGSACFVESVSLAEAPEG